MTPRGQVSKGFSPISLFLRDKGDAEGEVIAHRVTLNR
jgi:hypothetical protein